METLNGSPIRTPSCKAFRCQGTGEPLCRAIVWLDLRTSDTAVWAPGRQQKVWGFVLFVRCLGFLPWNVEKVGGFTFKAA